MQHDTLETMPESPSGKPVCLLRRPAAYTLRLILLLVAPLTPNYLGSVFSAVERSDVQVYPAL